MVNPAGKTEVLHYWAAGDMAVHLDEQGRLWLVLDAATAPRYIMMGEFNRPDVRELLI